MTETESGSGSPPEYVKASPRFWSDISTLSTLFDSETPSMVRLRAKSIATVVYGFGDASGVGVCGATDKLESSNWKEFTNVIEALEEEGASGRLDGLEIFMFTDNSTVKSCAAKGSSTSPKLLDLVIRLRALSLRHGVKVHLIHVAGTRMIAQGTDGVSRGFLGAGIMNGESMMSFIPIHLSACERSPGLVEWVKSWSGPDLIPLTALQWFERGHDIEGWEKGWDGFSRPVISSNHTVFLWSPLPLQLTLLYLK